MTKTHLITPDLFLPVAHIHKSIVSMGKMWLNRIIYSQRKYYCYHQDMKQLWCHPIIQISNIAIAILDFSLLLLVKLSLLILFASFLVIFFFWWLFLKSYRSFLLWKAIAKRLPLLFAKAFKSVKERQLLLSQ